MSYSTRLSGIIPIEPRVAAVPADGALAGRWEGYWVPFVRTDAVRGAWDHTCRPWRKYGYTVPNTSWYEQVNSDLVGEAGHMPDIFLKPNWTVVFRFRSRWQHQDKLYRSMTGSFSLSCVDAVGDRVCNWDRGRVRWTISRYRTI